MRVNFYTNACTSKFKDNGGGIWALQGIPMTVDNAVMNGIYYPEDENAKGLNTYKGKPVALRHPSDENGNPTSAVSGSGLFNYYSGGVITNVYNHNGINYFDAEFNVNMMRAQKNGDYFADKIEKKEPIGVSTGLYFDGNNEEGVTANGEKYIAVAKNQQGDHVAMLPDDEPPAGGKDTFIRFNGENNDQTMAINIDEFVEMAISNKDLRTKGFSIMRVINMLTGNNSGKIGFRLLSEKIEQKLREKYSNSDRYIWAEEVYDNYFVYIDDNGILKKQAYILSGEDEVKFVDEPVSVSKDVEYVEIRNREDDAMRETLIAALAAKGITVNAEITDAELLAKYNEANTPDVAAAVNAAIKPLADELAEVKGKLTENANKELDALAEQAAPLLGVEKDEAKSLGANALHKVLAKNGVVVGGAVVSGKPEEETKVGLNAKMPWEE